MEGIVSLLDAAHDAQVRALGAELTAALGLGPGHLPPFPHFSYQIAPAYDHAAVAAALAQAAAAQPPFTVTTAGLAVFPNDPAVLYLPLIRTAALSAFHQRLWQSLAPLATDRHPYYHPDQWMAHITLLAGLDAATAGAALTRLTRRDLYWTIPIDTLCFVTTVNGHEVIDQRFRLTRQAQRGRGLSA